MLQHHILIACAQLKSCPVAANWVNTASHATPAVPPPPRRPPAQYQPPHFNCILGWRLKNIFYLIMFSSRANILFLSLGEVGGWNGISYERKHFDLKTVYKNIAIIVMFPIITIIINI